MTHLLEGLLSATQQSLVSSNTELLFKDVNRFKFPEALFLYEQSLLPAEQLFDLSQTAYNLPLYEPRIEYVPKEIVEKFRGKNVFVISYDNVNHTVVLGTTPDFDREEVFSLEYQTKIVNVPLYYYVTNYTKQYGMPDFLCQLPAVDLWRMIVREAVDLGASDITLSNTANGALAYYNVRKRKVRSKRYIPSGCVDTIIQTLATSANATLGDNSVIPRSFSVNLDKYHRGRVEVNKNYYGHLMTIRVLSNRMLDKSLEDWNLTPATCKFIRDVFLSKEKGLRLLIGETSSGKNTTLVSALKEIADTDRYKIVSVEQPVEILVDGIEQCPAETEEEFALIANSLLRQNPDYVYFTEITARTATAVMQQANTSKAVFSSIHANSISDVLFRLQDITSMPLDRLILTLQSCIFQELVRDEKADKVYPVTRCVHFDDDLKMALYSKSTGEIKKILKGEEDKWR